MKIFTDLINLLVLPLQIIIVLLFLKQLLIHTIWIRVNIVQIDVQPLHKVQLAIVPDVLHVQPVFNPVSYYYKNAYNLKHQRIREPCLESLLRVMATPQHRLVKFLSFSQGNGVELVDDWLVNWV